MDDLLTVAVGQGVSHLADVLCREGLVEPAVILLLQGLVQLSFGSKLQYEIDPTLIVKIPKQSQYVVVS